MDNAYDLIVIGSGPGGYVAAIRASQLGLKTAIIEKDKPGGVCLNVGCIPSKSLIQSAEIFHNLKKGKDFGIDVNFENFDFSKVHKKSRLAADKLSKAIQYLLKKNDINFIQGTGKLSSENEILVDDKQKLQAKNIVIATGSRPKSLTAFEIDEKKILSSTGALFLEELPESIAILGAGAIGVEFAYILNTFGVQVHLVEFLEQILPLEDQEISKLVTNSFKKKGIKIHTATKAKSYKEENGNLIIQLENSKGDNNELKVNRILSAVGRLPNSEELGLENLGIITENGFIKTGDFYQTNISNIYAIGDVINSPLLAHVASKEGEIAIEHIAGHSTEKRINKNLIPSAIYSDPEVASFGYTEDKAKKENLNVKSITFPYKGIGKSVAIEKPEGLIKIIYEPSTKELLGGHIVGKNATEIIHELLLSKKAELLPEDISSMIHIHPTISEGIMEAMKGVVDKPIHGI